MDLGTNWQLKIESALRCLEVNEKKNPLWELQEEAKQNSPASLPVAPNLVFTASIGILF